MTRSTGAPRRLGFDAIRALQNTTGLGNYARLLLSGVAEVAPELELHLYTPRPARMRYAGVADLIGGHTHAPDWPWRVPVARNLWRSFRLGHDARRDGIGIFHGLTQELPRDLPATGIKSVLSVPDLLYLTRPELFPAFDRLSYLWRYRWSAEHADLVIAISAGTRRELLKQFELDPAKVVILPPAVEPRYFASGLMARPEVIDRHHQSGGAYIIVVGSLEPRKNQRLAVEAQALMPADGPHLLIVGQDRGGASTLGKLIRDRGLNARVSILSTVDDDDLPALVAGATLACYLSTGEGFGMPIVEAMAAGVPVIAARGGNLEDAGGDAALYVDPHNPTELATLWQALLADPGRLAELERAGRSHAAKFDRRVLAERLVALYDALYTEAPVPEPKD